MKRKYQVNKLYIGQLMYVSSKITEYGPKYFTTQQKYIFTNKSYFFKTRRMYQAKYYEIFTKNIFKLKESQIHGNIAAMKFNLPYIVNLEPFTKYFPHMANKSVTDSSLLLMLDEINFKTQR